MMKKEVILIFDVGKTNKKVLLFDRELGMVHEEESRFAEVTDDDGFPCDDADRLESWLIRTIHQFISNEKYQVKGVNVTTYGATLVYLDGKGKRMTPVYNYLKPLPDHVLEGFYESHGGIEDFSRKTASPALGMLNSGLQLLWLKRTKPEIFNRVRHVLHLPQYLSFLLTKRLCSEHTSIGCHTMMWDFDAMQYHPWIREEGITLPEPDPVSNTIQVQLEGCTFETGIGIHDSSASLAPYIQAAREPFILISTGTWCISMNPYNHESLTAEELRQDCLCYMGVNRKPVKSSRFFLGHIHDVNVERLESHFQAGEGTYKRIVPKPDQLRDLWNQGEENTEFFGEGIPAGYVDSETDLSQFKDFGEAYTRLMMDLTQLAVQSVRLLIPRDDTTNHLYITGGFAKNPFFTGFMAIAFQDKEVFTSEMDNATSLGAALVISGKVWPDVAPTPDLGLYKVE
jgi:sugar (pentulose or hexulose) kinase